jgi:hypothetical protein
MSASFLVSDTNAQCGYGCRARGSGGGSDGMKRTILNFIYIWSGTSGRFISVFNKLNSGTPYGPDRSHAQRQFHRGIRGFFVGHGSRILRVQQISSSVSFDTNIIRWNDIPGSLCFDSFRFTNAGDCARIYVSGY